MTKEDKELLLKDLSARLPYGVILHNEEGYDGHLNSISQTIFGTELGVNITATKRVNFQLDTIKPYLRPMSSMTDEEADEFEKISDGLLENGENTEIWDTVVDWLNTHHFDHRGLIGKGLALEAPEDMYKTE